MMRSILGSVLGVLALLAAGACGETSGSVLERVPETATVDAGDDAGDDDAGATVPRILRAVAFAIPRISTCAVGEPCGHNNEPDTRGDDDCFEIETNDGVRLGFRGDTVEFVPRDDPRVTDPMAQASCFDLDLDEQALTTVRQNFAELQGRIYDLSDKRILLDVTVHEVQATLTVGFEQADNEWTLVLPKSALLEETGIVSRETDFTFVVTAASDQRQGFTPRVEDCSVTADSLGKGLGGAGLTWLTNECDGVNSLLRQWMFQVGFALRDANRFNDAFDRAYPPCGDAEGVNPDAWWPTPDECSVDPDSQTCNDDRCEGTDERYVRHVLTAHWPRERAFVGNHCNDDKRDFDETEIDEGGACAALAGR